MPQSQGFLCIIPAGAECRTSLKKLLKGCRFGRFVWFGRTITKFGRKKKKEKKVGCCTLCDESKVRVICLFQFPYGSLNISALVSRAAEQVQVCKNQDICGHYQFLTVMFVACYLIPFDWWQAKPGADWKFFSQWGVLLKEKNSIMNSHQYHCLLGCVFCWEFFRAVELWMSLKAQEMLWQVCIFCHRIAYPALPNLYGKQMENLISCETEVEMSPHFFGRAGLNLCCCETERTRNKEK